MKVTDEMVNRFLSWSLPKSFGPDCGITFAPPTQGWPVGTNLLTATEARAMLEHVLEAATPSIGGVEPDDPGATTHALVMAHMLLGRIRDKTGTVPYFEANAVMQMIDAVLPKSMVAPSLGGVPQFASIDGVPLWRCLSDYNNDVHGYEWTAVNPACCPKCGKSEIARVLLSQGAAR